MATKYGYPENIWNKAKEEMRQILIERAKVRGMIPYSELVKKIRTIQLEPDSYALANMLGEVSTEESRAGHGMLSAIVVHKSGDMEPGPGFFDLAKSLGNNTSDILAFWVNEFKKVHAYWGRSK